MSNPNENKSYNREVRQESYNDANGHNHTHVTRTNETVNNVSNPNTYRDGYVDGQVTENRYQQEVLTERDNENAGRGLLIGILLTSLAALTAGAIWYYNQRDDATPTTIVVPNSQPAPSPSPEAKQNTTIIEKTRNVPVPVVVPQQQAPAPAPQAPAPAPDINISVPNSVTQPPATQEAPATEPAPSPSGSESSSTSESQSSSTDTQGTQSSTDSTTPAAGTSSQTDTTSGSTPTGGGSTGDAGQ